MLLLFVASCAASVPKPEPQRPSRAPAPASTGPCRVVHHDLAGTTTTDYTYERGRRSRALAQGPSGERQTLWSYDAQGRQTQQTVIAGSDIRTHRFFYERNLLVREEVHDAAADRVVLRRSRSYDDAGHLRARSEERWHAGAFVRTDHHALHYDAQGRFVYELRTLSPPSGPPALHSITVETDSAGRVVARRIDESMDGTFDRVSLFAFDDGGRVTTVTQMRGDTVATVTRHEHDAQGRLVGTTVEDAAGQLVGETAYAFDCSKQQQSSSYLEPFSPAGQTLLPPALEGYSDPGLFAAALTETIEHPPGS